MKLILLVALGLAAILRPRDAIQVVGFGYGIMMIVAVWVSVSGVAQALRWVKKVVTRRRMAIGPTLGGR